MPIPLLVHLSNRWSILLSLAFVTLLVGSIRFSTALGTTRRSNCSLTSPGAIRLAATNFTLLEYLL